MWNPPGLCLSENGSLNSSLSKPFFGALFQNYLQKNNPFQRQCLSLSLDNGKTYSHVKGKVIHVRRAHSI